MLTLAGCVRFWSVLVVCVSTQTYGQPTTETPPALAGAAPADAGEAVSVPVNQVLTPAGIQIQLEGVRPQVIAVSPDGRLLATSGKHEIVLLDPSNGRIVQTVGLPSANARGE